MAYSTVAQIGYLFLMFPLAFDAGGSAIEHGAALAAGTLQAISHATAKAGMFMAAGLVYAALGHDRIADLAGVAFPGGATATLGALGPFETGEVSFDVTLDRTVSVPDTIGAGDSFSGALINCLLGGADIVTASRIAGNDTTVWLERREAENRTKPAKSIS